MTLQSIGKLAALIFAASLSTAHGAPLSEAASDFNGDGSSDILYRNATNGQLFRMFMNGFVHYGEAIVYAEPDTSWKVVADADFDGDGMADLLWRNGATGQVYVMPFDDDGRPTAGATIATEPNPAWKIVHQPDIDGDGKDDILWWNSSTGQVYVMLMNGTAIAAEGFAYTEPNTQWTIIAVGDFTGSGRKNQLLWRNAATGQVYQQTLSFAGGIFLQVGAVIYTERDLAWKILGAADFDGDGRSDILWRRDGTGQVYVMPMEGATVKPGGIVYTEPDPAWKIVAHGDYDGDDRSDLLWRNDSTGQLFLVRLDGLATAGYSMIYAEPDTAWKVLGPHEYAR